MREHLHTHLLGELVLDVASHFRTGTRGEVNIADVGEGVDDIVDTLGVLLPFDWIRSLSECRRLDLIQRALADAGNTITFTGKADRPVAQDVHWRRHG